jgi:dihydroorotase-like cyclic amidohydrolase
LNEPRRGSADGFEYRFGIGGSEMSSLRLPGLIDIHVHLRDPGATHKEDFSTGTAAALAGGVVTVLDMPNNTPPTVDPRSLRHKSELAAQKARCDYGFYLGATAGNAAKVVPGPGVVGIKMYLNETYGPLRIDDLSTLIAHFKHWPKGKPIAAHAEGLSTAMVIALAQVYDRRAHICHVSRKAEIELIKRAKERGVKVTCEVTPHHLFLTEADAERLGSLGYTKPTLGRKEDNDALWANLQVVDAIASDHAPHSRSEKEGNAPPPGVPGVETTLPLLLNAAAEGRLSLERVVELTHSGPARVMGLQPPEESYVEVETEDSYELRGAEMFTKCRWSPFEGMVVKGRVRRVFLRGVMVFEGNQVLAAPGWGKPVALQ